MTFSLPKTLMTLNDMTLNDPQRVKCQEEISYWEVSSKQLIISVLEVALSFYFCLVYPAFFSQDILKFVHFPLSLSILFTFTTETRVENAHFCLITCIFTPLIFAFRRGKKCPRSHFSCSPHHFFCLSSLEKNFPASSGLCCPKDKISRWIAFLKHWT